MSTETSRRFPPTGRKRVPTILQMEAVECGAACLAMVLAHHGKWVPLEELRVACGVSRDGSKAKNVVQAARRYGLVAEGWRTEPDKLAGKQLPAILFWEFNHFVVLEGVGRKVVHLNDPASGPRTVTHDEFGRAFTGVMLTMAPGPDFTPSGARTNAWGAVRDQLAPSRHAVLFLVLAGLAALAPGVFVPAATKIFVDDILVRHLTDWMRPLLFGLVCAALLGGLLNWLQGYFMARLQWKLGVSLGLKLIWRLLRLSPSFFAQRYAGDIASRLATTERACDLIGSQVSALLVTGLAALFYGALMAVYDPVLAGIGLALALFNAVFARLMARRQENAARTVMREQAALGSLSISGIQSVETLKATATEDDFLNRWANAQARTMNAVHRSQLPLQILDLIPRALGVLTMAAILGVGGWRVMEGVITVGTLAAFQTVLSSFLSQVGGLVGVASGMRELRVAMERVDDVLRYPLDRRLDPTSAPEADGPPHRLSGAVDVADLSYGYNPLDPPLVDGFSLTVAPGSRIALVGPSGSGKSTIARLLVGLAEPWAGSIAFDGQPRAKILPGVLAASVAYVEQSVVLMEGTVRENLTLWDSQVSERKVVEAARDAGLHETIAARPGGYDAPVSEGGSNWSGGQAQRLEIARALVGEPSILVLDEATSALDATTEATILENLRRRGCTIILVTHRLSAIRDCDEILVLDRGRIVQRGSHEALYDQPGIYGELIRAA
ncbi:NHLP family bacteriocin export ABC transporter peptidase/permease/ATPase subunit [Methylobacterium currus]|uniref:NHLP family bacteriocin export ABC transporter peptidase/permease/ATPase subunit n=1 Tax=Methylobacterium currus TaxID=2051553 RepID=A0A2R4WMF7_9HYPH|nr:NHLP family bacteriocin export ABC transporter peptidase/permease/ATPase subunit [Methylobacterium currus]AWB22719.1 NHLP family bacteriocin export ABC transporter peptidase/permease/ATPase subunit [Methylobacterium currus]UHC17684.1 NHLP family bacteriocin export ABC transporter peptidase/permease/ATPase subunit [Methylobacterium currus]